MTEQMKDRIAGFLAILAGLCWFVWAAVNAFSGHGLEYAHAGSAMALVNGFLTAGWNLLLIPAAFRLYLRFRNAHRGFLLTATIAGVLSFVLWGIGGFSGISHNLETGYLILAAAWLLSLGMMTMPSHRSFGYLTLAVGALTAVDAVFNLFEPVPFLLYLLASPKLPLCAGWSVAAGVLLLRGWPGIR
jgi:hypothetical protein